MRQCAPNGRVYAGNSDHVSQFPQEDPQFDLAQRMHYKNSPNFAPTSTVQHAGAPKPLDNKPKPAGPLPERQSQPWYPPHEVYDARNYPGGQGVGMVYQQREQPGSVGRYVPHGVSSSGKQQEKYAHYRGNQAQPDGSFKQESPMMQKWNPRMVPEFDPQPGTEFIDPVLEKVGETWTERAPIEKGPAVRGIHSSAARAATGEARHDDQDHVGYGSINDWSQFRGDQMDPAAAAVAERRALPAQQIVGEVMTEFNHTTTHAKDAGVIEYYARGGASGQSASPYYKQNIYGVPSAGATTRLPTDRIPAESGPAWLSDLRPNWAQKAAPSHKENYANAIERVKKVFIDRGCTSGRQFNKIVQYLDADGSGAVDIFELINGLARFGVQLSKSEAEAVMVEYDKDGNRRIELAEFMEAIRGNLTSARGRVVEIAFNEMDVDKSGDISMHEVSACYDARTHPEVLSGKMTREEAHDDFVQAMDKNQDAVISKQEFINFFKDISMAFDNDDDFAKFVRGMWRRRR